MNIENLLQLLDINPIELDILYETLISKKELTHDELMFMSSYRDNDFTNIIMYFRIIQGNS